MVVPEDGLGDLRCEEAEPQDPGGFVVAFASEHAPGDTGQLVGKCHSQDIAMQASGRRLEPGAEAVLGSVFRSQQYHTGAPNEERAQVPDFPAVSVTTKRPAYLGSRFHTTKTTAALSQRTSKLAFIVKFG